MEGDGCYRGDVERIELVAGEKLLLEAEEVILLGVGDRLSIVE